MTRLQPWLLLLLGLMTTAAALAQPPAEKVAATVNGEKITEEQFLTTLKARYGDRVLNALVSNLAIRQAAKAAGVTVPRDELERRYLATQRAVEMRAPVTGENFELWLAKQALTKEYFLTELYDQMLLERMVQKQVNVTNEDVALFYQRNKDQLTEPAQMRVAHICVKTEKEAEAIRSEIVSGKITWEDAAKKYSLDPWTKDNGGDMGFVTPADTEFHRTAFALKTNNEISNRVVMSPMGYHLLRRTGFKAQRVPQFEEIEASIREQLERNQLKALTRQKREEILKAAKFEILTQPSHEPFPPAAPAATPAPAPK